MEMFPLAESTRAAALTAVLSNWGACPRFGLFKESSQDFHTFPIIKAVLAEQLQQAPL